MKVDYIDHMGTDLTVANAARVSFAKESKEFTFREDKEKGSDEGIIEFLARENHWTPFSHCMITMREKVPIFVARQRFKHMVGFSYNEVSRRYVDDEPEFFVPDVWRKRAENKKQGSDEEETINLLERQVIEGLYGQDAELVTISQDIHKEYRQLVYYARDLYNRMIDNGVAPEQARMVLPQSMYTEYYVTGSLAAWARAYKLRIDVHAQKEIQELAVEWDKVIKPLFPVSWKVLID